MKSNLSAITLLAAAAFLLGGEDGGAPAYASDIFDKGGLKDEAPSDRPINWSGVYLSGQLGVVNANHNVSLQKYEQVRDATPAKCSTGAVNQAGTGCVDSGATFTPADDGLGYLNLFNLDGLSSTGFIGGGRVGYDQQVGRFVFGVFGEYNISDAETTAAALDGFNETGPVYDRYSLEKDGEWSIGARAGLLLNPRLLAYVLAAYTQTDYNLNGLSADDIADGFKRSQTFTGVSVGGGLEYALTRNVFVGMEYSHTFYGSEKWLDQHTGPDGATEICDERVVDDLDEDRVMGRITVKLNGGLLD